MQDNDKKTATDTPETFEVVEAEHRTGARHKGVYLLQPVYHGGSVRRVLRHRGGHERAF